MAEPGDESVEFARGGLTGLGLAGLGRWRGVVHTFVLPCLSFLQIETKGYEW